MTLPCYNKDELWARIRKLSLEQKEIHALKFNDNYHVITVLDDERMKYSIRFKSMKEHELLFNELYVMYEELYRNGWIDSVYLSKHCRRLYNRPYITNGSAMLAVLYSCDRNLLNDNGMLTVRSPRVVTSG